MKVRDIALLAIAILFPVGVFWFVMSPDAVAWVIKGLMALPPGVLNIATPVGVGVSFMLIIAGAQMRKRKEAPEEPDAERDGLGRF